MGLMKIMSSFQSSSKNMQVGDLMTALVGNDFEWKVGDVDLVLNRNLLNLSETQ